MLKEDAFKITQLINMTLTLLKDNGVKKPDMHKVCTYVERLIEIMPPLVIEKPAEPVKDEPKDEKPTDSKIIVVPISPFIPAPAPTPKPYHQKKRYPNYIKSIWKVERDEQPNYGHKYTAVKKFPTASQTLWYDNSQNTINYGQFHDSPEFSYSVQNAVTKYKSVNKMTSL